MREATRFKGTYATVDNPTRDEQVIEEAVEGAPAVGLPQTIAAAVFEVIINSSVLFEQCVVSFHPSFLLLDYRWYDLKICSLITGDRSNM